MSKVIVLGHDVQGFSLHPENIISVPEWTGNPDDNLLEEFIDFFEALAFSNSKDLRPIISKYKGKDVISTFDNLQEGLYENLRKNNVSLAKKAQKVLYKAFGWEFNEMDSENPSYSIKKNNIRELRRKEFDNAKKVMSEQLQIELEKEKQYLAQHKMPFFDLITKGAPPPPPTIVDSELK